MVRFEQVALDSWDINCAYDVGTIVTYDGNSYVSLKTVPEGINIGFTDYWKKITVENDIESLQNNVEGIQEQLIATVGEDNVPFRFVYDTTTEKYGYLDGADTFHPF